MKRPNKNAIKRFCPPITGEPKGVQRPLKQSQTCLNYAECKHFGRSQTKGKYALLIAAATCIGFTINSSCSSDEDYDNYSSGKELFTRAEREMGRGNENGQSELVPYPNATRIKNDPTVKAKMQEAWELTKENSSPSGRTEYGFYIYYDATSDILSCGPMQNGEPSNWCGGEYGDSPDIDLGNDSNNVKVCAIFHTHTTIEYCERGTQRKTGASDDDKYTARLKKLPGLVYDYVDNPIHNPEHHKTDSAHIITFGRSQRAGYQTINH